MRPTTVALIVAVASLTLMASAPSPSWTVTADRNGGSKCAVCTLLVALVEQTMQIKNATASQAAQMICSYLPKLAGDACSIAMDILVPIVGPLIDQGDTADAVCNALHLCNNESGQTCRLFPAKGAYKSHDAWAKHVNDLRVATMMRHRAKIEQGLRSFNICTIVPAVCEIEDHRPFFDTDSDMFSTYDALRGSFWRGKDCDDLDAQIFPGRDTNDAFLDSNCNGIYGVDPSTQKTYEDQWCAGTGSMGVASLGDSATAHFRLPADYLIARGLSKDVFKNVLRLIENEADWPMLSWSTGHLDASQFSPDVKGPMSSIYHRMLERNRCNMRDFQNVGVNGASVHNLLPFEGVLARNRNAGLSLKPIFVVMSMIGNDVCGHHHNFNEMTTVEQYHKDVLAAVKNADAMLPNGSHVLLVPLVDGRVLYDTIHDRIHPIGSTNNDVTYADLYDYLNCLDISPCWGWMNSNETVRNMTTEHAMKLGAELPIIVQETQGQLTNIKVHFLGNLIDDGLKRYHGPMWHLIEPVDGFHPSQTGNALLGDFVFNKSRDAGIIPPANPNNAEIIAKFGDQGGY